MNLSQSLSISRACIQKISLNPPPHTHTRRHTRRHTHRHQHAHTYTHTDTGMFTRTPATTAYRHHIIPHVSNHKCAYVLHSLNLSQSLHRAFFLFLSLSLSLSHTLHTYIHLEARVQPSGAIHEVNSHDERHHNTNVQVEGLVDHEVPFSYQLSCNVCICERELLHPIPIPVVNW